MGLDWALLDRIDHVYLLGALTNAALIVLQEVEEDRLRDFYRTPPLSGRPQSATSRLTIHAAATSIFLMCNHEDKARHCYYSGSFPILYHIYPAKHFLIS